MMTTAWLVHTLWRSIRRVGHEGGHYTSLQKSILVRLIRGSVCRSRIGNAPWILDAMLHTLNVASRMYNHVELSDT